MHVSVCLCDETMFLFHLNKLLLYGIWRIRSIYTHIHSISFLIVCSFFSRSLGRSHVSSLVHSFVCIFPVAYFLSCNFVCTITFNSLLFFSFHFPGQYRLASATHHFFPSSHSIFHSVGSLRFFLSAVIHLETHILCLFHRFVSLLYVVVFSSCCSCRCKPYSIFSQFNRKMFAHFSFLAYHLRAENKNTNRK